MCNNEKESASPAAAAEPFRSAARSKQRVKIIHINLHGGVVKDFPKFMKHPANRIASQNQYTPGIEGYVFDGVDGSQMAFWTNRGGGKSAEHVHEYDEYFVVVEGQYTLIIEGKRIPVRVGEEYFIPKGVPHGGESVAGTRTIHAFGGKRARRESEGA
jgi:mannose-6-phosphate isomerase-like protein (cupin superfamily)